MSSIRLLFLLLIPVVASCSTDPGTAGTPPLYLEVGPGLTELLPHMQEGTLLHLTVLVTSGGKPAPGVQVNWYDNRIPSALSTKVSETNAEGIAESIWSLPTLPANLPWATYSTQVTVPGAIGNPIVYTIEVYRCTRC